MTDLNVRQSPTIAAFLAIVFDAINEQGPDTTLAIPGDFVSQVMEGIGLFLGREVGLNAMVGRTEGVRETRSDAMTDSELDELFSAPRAETTRCARRLAPGDVIILGAGGKMGPTLARMARRAAEADNRPRAGHAVSRWSSRDRRARQLNDAGVETIYVRPPRPGRLGDLPDAPNIVIFMAGQKFGTTGAPAMTWAMNTLVPRQHLRRTPSRMLASSRSPPAMCTRSPRRTPAARAKTISRDPSVNTRPPASAANGCFELYAERFTGTRGRDRATELRDRFPLRRARGSRRFPRLARRGSSAGLRWVVRQRHFFMAGRRESPRDRVSDASPQRHCSSSMSPAPETLSVRETRRALWPGA